MTRVRRLIVFASFAIALLPIQTMADTGDIGTIIESFVAKQFPDAASHFWIVNGTQWDGDEMIVDMNAIVTERREDVPTASRFLLLIVDGRLRGIQNIPLDAEAECQKEQEA